MSMAFVDQSLANANSVRLRPAISAAVPAGVAQARPQTFLLGRVKPGLRVVSPLQIVFERDDDGSYIVSDDLFGIYGEGRNPAEAQRDYVVVLCDYYQLLAAHAATDEANRVVFEQLQRYVTTD